MTEADALRRRISRIADELDELIVNYQMQMHYNLGIDQHPVQMVESEHLRLFSEHIRIYAEEPA